jgi:hypothetical protein
VVDGLALLCILRETSFHRSGKVRYVTSCGSGIYRNSKTLSPLEIHHLTRFKVYLWDKFFYRFIATLQFYSTFFITNNSFTLCSKVGVSCKFFKGKRLWSRKCSPHWFLASVKSQIVPTTVNLWTVAVYVCWLFINSWHAHSLEVVHSDGKRSPVMTQVLSSPRTISNKWSKRCQHDKWALLLEMLETSKLICHFTVRTWKSS